MSQLEYDVRASLEKLAADLTASRLADMSMSELVEFVQDMLRMVKEDNE